MPISFEQVPANTRVPFVYAEFSSARASQGPALLPYRALIIGQKTSSGSAAANTLHRVTRADQLIDIAGRGSMLHRMAMSWFANNTWTETWVGVLDDNPAGQAAGGTVKFGGAVSAPGTLNLYLGGNRVQVAVAAAEANADTATNVAAAINAKADLPVTAAVDGVDDTQVNLTYRHNGEVGNGYDVRVNYQDGEETPAGLTVTIGAMMNGTSNPVLDDLIAAMGDEWFHIWAMPYTDATSLTAVESELSDRFGPVRMIDGVCFTASNASHSGLGTLGDSRNSQHVSIMATNQSPTPVDAYAAAVAAVVAYYGQIDPARPFQTLPLEGVLPPAEDVRWTIEERNLLLYDGISTSKVAAGGVVRIERPITTYSQNAAGAEDTAYLDVTTMLTLMYLRYSFRNRILSRYPRHKLGDDGKRYGQGQAIITPKLGKAEALGWFREMEELALVEDFDQFKADLIVERDGGDPNRLNFLLPPDLINQFMVGAAQIQFRL
ncbi:phage tail sheath subtilisin-like domain-containing protein [Kaustia mangrovi]|uniref:Phage tail sheath subtilisin-like domain-containing protein n=1 Tax=Kaustia mangrovi TaxID=2593653 RepID=A0A7S8C5Y6_9HYPH|nr:phage tail sheath subtilisin-like domain-containing protein [Kaustia mangrovi]QPC44005.1 phage tail sheath subtilisin-like domain-containing protein [Kaustia mangrovi]